MADGSRRRWEEGYRASRLRDDVDFDTLSSVPLDPLYGPEDVDPRIGVPGEWPYTRGIYPSGYRGRLWTMRQFSGYGTAAQTNRRYKFLLDHGLTGLSVAFDMPTLMGLDSDDPLSEGEVGRCGVAIDSLADMEVLFDAIDLTAISTSMTISGPAPMLFAFYMAAAEKQGADLSRLDGTCQTDILKEYIAQKEWLFPPEPHLRLTADMMQFCLSEVPRYKPLSISGYHIREAGSTAVQELAFTLASGFAHVELGLRRGLAVDDFAPGLSFFFNSHIDFFEEIAKFRAARRIWARWMRDRYGAIKERSWMLKFHTQTAGVSLTAQQPFNNVVRTTTEALAAVLGGTQSLHTNSLDEVLALPSDEAVEISLRTQQVVAYETGATNVIDPLGGSWFVEELTERTEKEAEIYLARIDEMGDGSILDGMLSGIEDAYFQKEIADAAFRYQQLLEAGQKVIVGVNRFTATVQESPDLLIIGPDIEEGQTKAVAEVRANRDEHAAQDALGALRRAASEESVNTIPVMIEAAKAYVTLGELTETLRQVWGRYTEPPAF
ncbi:MAG: methylmalonyl-CoA mutase [Actinobacteria bacterium]|nr:methylmalonyl-CoA mutase [Actinomycetota bacterium]MDQ3532631.1 methylmalonyl-CoA mutase family protein [Actinomycetota bacterium]